MRIYFCLIKKKKNFSFSLLFYACTFLIQKQRCNIDIAPYYTSSVTKWKTQDFKFSGGGGKGESIINIIFQYLPLKREKIDCIKSHAQKIAFSESKFFPPTNYFLKWLKTLSFVFVRYKHSGLRDSTDAPSFNPNVQNFLHL